MRRSRHVLAALLVGALAMATPIGAAQGAETADPLITVSGTGFVDRQGREVVLRGFNVSGEVKLAERGFLPFTDAADARRSAVAMRDLAGANAVRFLLSWAAAEPAPGQVDQEYLRKVTEQAAVFADLGFAVLFDYHQDLYSRYLFHADSWYSGDGAPAWVVAAGNYPRESCGICLMWGQNITQNAAVQSAMYDFWHNRFGVQDAFLNQARTVLGYLRTHLTAGQFAHVVGIDPLNEPYAGRYDSGQDSRSWERDLLLPFYQRFRGAMDAAGWTDRPAFIEPNMFWNGNVQQQAGGFLDTANLGSRYVFNTHFYDQKAISGILMWGKASDGHLSADFSKIRQRATALGVPAIVTEFGHPLTGYTSDKAPSIDKAMYQALDSSLPGAQWWTRPADSGRVLSGTQWHWDIYSGRHHEAMNGNPNKILTEGDAWNGEDFSSVALSGSGQPALRQDARLLDRVYPAAVAGRTLAFMYEDRSRDGSTTMTWNPVPSSLPSVRTLVGANRYAVVVWSGSSGGAPTEVQLPAGFQPTVVSDVSSTVDGRRLKLSSGPGRHFAVVTDAGAPSAELLNAARAELATWAAAKLPA
jgi:hypothetical protein